VQASISIMQYRSVVPCLASTKDLKRSFTPAALYISLISLEDSPFPPIFLEYMPCTWHDVLFYFSNLEIQMNRFMQELVWSRLPLNEFQRQDLLNNLLTEMHLPVESNEDLEMTSQVIKKRKRGHAIEQSETSSHKS
jgi:hypothetical protein